MARSLAESTSVPSRSKISSRGAVKCRGRVHARRETVSDFAFAERKNLSIGGAPIRPGLRQYHWHRAELARSSDIEAWAKARRRPGRWREPRREKRRAENRQDRRADG